MTKFRESAQVLAREVGTASLLGPTLAKANRYRHDRRSCIRRLISRHSKQRGTFTGSDKNNAPLAGLNPWGSGLAVRTSRTQIQRRFRNSVRSSSQRVRFRHLKNTFVIARLSFRIQFGPRVGHTVSVPHMRRYFPSLRRFENSLNWPWHQAEPQKGRAYQSKTLRHTFGVLDVGGVRALTFFALIICRQHRLLPKHRALLRPGLRPFFFCFFSSKICPEGGRLRGGC